jgi:hypothetical protein
VNVYTEPQGEKMTNFTVLAFDPGGATGWAMYQAEKVPLPLSTGDYTDMGGVIRISTSWQSYEMTEEKYTCGTFDYKEHHLALGAFIERQVVQETYVVSESFEFRQGTTKRTGLDLSSREYIGVMKYICADRDIPFTQQTAALGKGFVSDDKLKASGLWIGGRDNRHAMDAYRHLIYFMVNKLRRHDLVKAWKGL